MNTCIACGCSEFEPCPGGCSWAVLDPDLGIGLCSSCVVLPLEDLQKKIEQRGGSTHAEA